MSVVDSYKAGTMSGESEHRSDICQVHSTLSNLPDANSIPRPISPISPQDQTMPAIRSQKEKTTQEPREPKIRWPCPFDGCSKTVSKKPDMRRHYRTHFNWIPFQCPYYANCKFQSQQESNVAVHISQTRMHPEINPLELAEAKPVRVLPESSAPQLPAGWDQTSGTSTVSRSANPRRLPAAVRRTVAESDAPAGSLDNFRILNFNHHSANATPRSPPRCGVSSVNFSTLADLSDSESSDEEQSNGPSTPSPSPATLVYHMTTEQVQLPIDFSSKMQLGLGEMKADSLTWTWDQLDAENVTDHTKTVFTDARTLDCDLSPLLESYDYDLFGKMERGSELVPGFETTDLSGWNLDDDRLFPGTMAGSSGLSIPDDVYYNPAPSPKFSEFINIDQGSPSPVVSASPAEAFSFSSADYFVSSPTESLDELFDNSLDSSSWNQISTINWDEVFQTTDSPLMTSS